MRHTSRLLLLLLVCPLVLTTINTSPLQAQIPKPTDAPPPLSPEESAQKIKLPPGFRLELVASEPLVRQPSGVCWDEHGRLFVCELHGYNLEGQYDIDDLNRSGQLDRVVRRIQANPRAKEAAQTGTYGTVKRLTDTDGDGRMDRVDIMADQLPPCYGICPARGGLILACAPDIIYLADRDGDGRAEIRETLFTGFATGALERGINSPQWGLDDWIYIGRGHTGGTITGPHLAQPVRLGGTDFRIKADGSAIEPVTGATHTFGHAFTASGDRFVVTTSRPGLYVTPLPWRYLARNPDAAAPAADQDAGGYTRAFPIALPHPWRRRRADDPGFFKYYRDRYGASDSDAGGYFTSGCGPLVYQDVAFPFEYRGDYFFCEPAQNLIHHAEIERDGPALRLRRGAGEEQSEFLASADSWFHPMHLQHGPDGAIWITDMYREIIEDYSAIPRYLQQQYGLTNGMDHGRVWRLTHQDAPRMPSADMARLSPETLSLEIASPHYWRRQTARRLLVERKQTSVAPKLRRLLGVAKETAAALNALSTLDALEVLTAEDAALAMGHSNPSIRLHGLRFAERWLDSHPSLLEQVMTFTDERDPSVLLQLALSLGASHDPRVLPTLASLARAQADIKWMPNAILTSVSARAGLLLEELAGNTAGLGSATPLLEPLTKSIAARSDAQELSQTFILLASLDDAAQLLPCLRGLQAGLKNKSPAALSSPARQALLSLTGNNHPEVRRVSAAFVELFQALDPAQLQAIIEQAARDAADVKLSAPNRLAAVSRLTTLDHPRATAALLAAWPSNTPQVRQALLDALFARRDRLPALLGALETSEISPATLTAFQRVTLLEHENADLRRRAGKILQPSASASDETFRRFQVALVQPRDTVHGQQVFRDNCATCHQTKGIGFAVGPDLGAEFQRAEEAILRDILAPNDVISAGYATYVLDTTAGQSLSGILASESATSLTLRQPIGLELTVLRKDISRIRTLPVSLMPEALVKTLPPKDVADVIAWLREVDDAAARSPSSIVLFDDEPAFLTKLTEGSGTAALATEDVFSGNVCLTVTPPQRYSPRISGWNYRIAETPGPGEFRYLRLAWKTRGGEGVMVELAAEGRWPDSKSAQRRYYAGKNTTQWEAHQTSTTPPRDWRLVTVDLWNDNGSFTLTGIAPTAMGGLALFDKIELLRDLRDVGPSLP